MRNYEGFSTTADIGIRFKGRDFRCLYENALWGLNLLLFGSRPRRSGRDESFHFRYSGDGPENVLVNFLAEVLFLAYQKKKQVVRLDFIRADGCMLEARLLLAPCRSEPKIEIKSVTYHQLRVVEKNGMKSAAMIFDI
ncbi:MAG TPA: archease [Patescibacteria group bacterium]|nr:archease [Patescibacteria group bacterium]